MLPVFDNRVSKNSFFPSSTLSGVIGLSGGIAISPSGPTSGVGAGGVEAAGAGFSVLLAHEVANTSNGSARIFRDFMDAFLTGLKRSVKAYGRIFYH